MPPKSNTPVLGRLRRRRQALLRAIAKIEREMATVERQVLRLQEQQARCDDGRSDR